MRSPAAHPVKIARQLSKAQTALLSKADLARIFLCASKSPVKHNSWAGQRDVIQRLTN
jgi:hypothetical protein